MCDHEFTLALSVETYPDRSIGDISLVRQCKKCTYHISDVLPQSQEFLTAVLQVLKPHEDHTVKNLTRLLTNSHQMALWQRSNHDRQMIRADQVKVGDKLACFGETFDRYERVLKVKKVGENQTRLITQIWNS